MRVGLGYDIHPIKKGKKLYLGGIKISSSYGLEGHSDADVVLHALADALLGACGDKDIGYYFSDKDPRIKGISSIAIMKKVLSIVKKKRFKIVNVDIVVVTNAAKISVRRNKIIASVAGLLKIKKSAVSIKGKSNQGLGILGKNKAIACFAFCLLK
ncbi:MAG: 2-C-methyl-D-erythritol 2,4-cyclodiphosphate synthase [Deltaproteobacteria bacterium]|nr:2-C-methyl-D-erythritol 2,4-cyclodiphosphate synthase [Deltaproteobacteria bacterium]